MRRTCYIALFATALVFGGSPQSLAASAWGSIPMRTVHSAPRTSTSRVVTDELGRQVKIPVNIQRIVSLAPSITEMIYALKLDDRLAGDTDYCDVPKAAKTKPHVGSVLSPNLEAIIALHPDVVFAIAYSGDRRETVDALQQVGVAVYNIDPRTVAGMLDSMAHIAKIAGAGNEGTGVVARLRSRLESLQTRLADVPKAHVLFVVQLEPLITTGQHTFIADALQYAGAESVVLSKEDWPKLSLEEVVRLQPDYIVMASSHMGDVAHTVEDLRSRAVWKDLMAVQAGRVAIISEEIDRPAPGLIDAVEQLAHQIHADAFAANPSRETRRKLQVDIAASDRDFARCVACAH